MKNKKCGTPHIMKGENEKWEKRLILMLKKLQN